MQTTVITYRFKHMTADKASDFIKKLYAVGACSVVPSGEGNVYVLRVTFPIVNEYDDEYDVGE